MRYLLPLVCLVFTLTVSPGCSKMTAEEVAQTKASILDTQTNLDSSKATVEAEKAAALAAADAEKVAKLQKSLDTIARLKALSDKALATLNAATLPDGTIDDSAIVRAALNTASATAPAFGPWGIGVSAGLGLVSTIVGIFARRRTNIAASIVNSIDTAAANDPAFAEALKKVGPKLAAEQAKTAGAHEFVEANRV